MKIVVTGTIGSGKSTLCAALATRLPGFSVVSVDDIVRNIYDDADFLTHLSNDFGVVSRKEASDLVFAAPTKRQALEQLSLRYVRPKLAAALEAENLIVEFPLLFEMSDFACRADLVVAVGCDDATQEARVVARDKMSLGKLQAIRASQYSRRLRAALSDVYVDTGASQEQQDKSMGDILECVHANQLKRRALAFFGEFAGPSIWNVIHTRCTEANSDNRAFTRLSELFTRLDATASGHPYSKALELAAWSHDSDNGPQSVKGMWYLLSHHTPAWLRVECTMHDQVYLAAEIMVALPTRRIDAAWVLVHSDRACAAEIFLNAHRETYRAGSTTVLPIPNEATPSLPWMLP